MTRPLAVITGPSRGIGRATALRLAARGLDVALLGRPGAGLESIAQAVTEKGVRAVPIPCDVSLPEQVGRAADQVLAVFGPPDVVVHNAGIVRRGAIEATTLADWDDVLSVNLRAPFVLTRALLPTMRARGQGRFVFVASISSTIGCGGNASYAASKWGVLGLAKSLAEELRGTRLSSVAVLPGSVDTDMLTGSGFAPAMTPDDVAGTIAYLALDAPLAMNGSGVEVFG